MEHQLALSVYNDGSHYKDRCERFLTDTPETYRAYLDFLVLKEARKQHKQFEVVTEPRDRVIAAKELFDAMSMHMEESIGGEAERAEVTHAVIYMFSLEGKSVAPKEAVLAYWLMSAEQRVRLLGDYKLYSAVPA